tara:strand:- start:69 stop:245 length:177 start_codon:yes stop_codon:yes gene_type:complete
MLAEEVEHPERHLKVLGQEEQEAVEQAKQEAHQLYQLMVLLTQVVEAEVKEMVVIHLV